ncbi:MAG: hypothetical protein F8N36_14680 [Desulfovibrio sp.]|uniref:hypothetical protein n=1 Tax=Desulfovibrio sp. TaxID=885 RepID=UPI00135E0718|nr:hypothetical protein [Desulfovibrio sp.]MTJ94084.1 hypothetical protein [Desulfovibrio sp.]
MSDRLKLLPLPRQARPGIPSGRLRNRAVPLLLVALACAVLLPVGGCGMSVKPSGQVVTEIGVGR